MGTRTRDPDAPRACGYSPNHAELHFRRGAMTSVSRAVAKDTVPAAELRAGAEAGFGSDPAAPWAVTPRTRSCGCSSSAP